MLHAARSTVRPAGAVEPARDAIVVCADAFDAMPLLPPRSVDLVLTSPPYWGLRTYGLEFNESILEEWAGASTNLERCPGYAWYRHHGGVLGMEPYPEWYVAHLVEILERVRGALKEDASLWVNLGDTYFARWSSIRSNGRQGLAGAGRVRRHTPSGGWRHDKQLLLLPARFAIAMQEAGWILRNDLICAKRNPTPRPESDRLRLSHEHFFHFVQRTPGARPRYYYDLTHAEPRALDVVSSDRGAPLAGHSATFAASLVRPRILTCCRPSGTVLDPFCGAGTTLAVAVEEGRNAIGFELNRTFATVAANELARTDEHAPMPGLIKIPVEVIDMKGFEGWSRTRILS